MAETNGKREIEAVCDTWEGGLIGYLLWKIGRRMEELNKEDSGGIDSGELDEMDMAEVNPDINDEDDITIGDLDNWDVKEILADEDDDGIMDLEDDNIPDENDGIYDF
jgi:hypothetical protein